MVKETGVLGESHRPLASELTNCHILGYGLAGFLIQAVKVAVIRKHSLKTFGQRGPWKTKLLHHWKFISLFLLKPLLAQSSKCFNQSSLKCYGLRWRAYGSQRLSPPEFKSHSGQIKFVSSFAEGRWFSTGTPVSFTIPLLAAWK